MATIKLNDDTLVPVLAFGSGTTLYKRDQSNDIDRNTVELIKSAIDAGYRHLDTAEMYGTEKEVGAAISESLDEGTIKSREELFITTKISSDFLNSAQHIDASLRKLGLGYVDLYLLHAPYWADSKEDLQKAWAGLEAVKESGKAKSIGFHPYFSKRQGKPYLPALRTEITGNVAVAAYGALSPLTRNIPGPLDDILKMIAEKYAVTPDLICLRWCLDQDVVVVTTTRKRERIKEYLHVFDFKLSSDDIEEIHRAGQACVSDQEPTSRVVKYYDGLKSKA